MPSEEAAEDGPAFGAKLSSGTKSALSTAKSYLQPSRTKTRQEIKSHDSAIDDDAEAQSASPVEASRTKPLALSGFKTRALEDPDRPEASQTKPLALSGFKTRALDDPDRPEASSQSRGGSNSEVVPHARRSVQWSPSAEFKSREASSLEPIADTPQNEEEPGPPSQDSDDPCLCEGHLPLMGKDGTSTSRYFCLYKDRLEYYKNSSEKNSGSPARGCVAVADVQKFEPREDGLCLHFEMPGGLERTLIFNFASSEEKDRWITAYQLSNLKYTVLSPSRPDDSEMPEILLCDGPLKFKRLDSSKGGAISEKYFYLYANRLDYFSSPEEKHAGAQPRGCIALQDVNADEVELLKDGFYLPVKNDTRTLQFHFRPPSDHEIARWHSALTMAFKPLEPLGEFDGVWKDKRSSTYHNIKGGRFQLPDGTQMAIAKGPRGPEVIQEKDNQIQGAAAVAVVGEKRLEWQSGDLWVRAEVPKAEGAFYLGEDDSVIKRVCIYGTRLAWFPIDTEPQIQLSEGQFLLEAIMDVEMLSKLIEEGFVLNAGGLKIKLREALRKDISKEAAARLCDTTNWLKELEVAVLAVRAEKAEQAAASAPPAAGDTFSITIENGGGANSGAKYEIEDDSLKIKGIMNNVGDGAFPAWNAEHPQQAVQPGDYILEVDGASGDAVELLRRLRDSNNVTIKLLRPKARGETEKETGLEEEAPSESFIKPYVKPASPYAMDKTVGTAIQVGKAKPKFLKGRPKPAEPVTYVSREVQTEETLIMSPNPLQSLRMMQVKDANRNNKFFRPASRSAASSVPPPPRVAYQIPARYNYRSPEERSVMDPTLGPSRRGLGFKHGKVSNDPVSSPHSPDGMDFPDNLSCACESLCIGDGERKALKRSTSADNISQKITDNRRLNRRPPPDSDLSANYTHSIERDPGVKRGVKSEPGDITAKIGRGTGPNANRIDSACVFKACGQPTEKVNVVGSPRGPVPPAEWFMRAAG